ncbi:accessory Sec system glycosylation chaperone GtfB [Staphylococcus carnosus]|uniref:UDP-N-acetylglucosamine--peptide N-acetylglucosaminyltransferase stabilizing protein GtfB n=1 Tax=Staphylococcus carnosus TaxID=1281 RepID=A0AAJ0NHI7_STACA|nr:accessory Sec system glycosylation chaperone GtfB [Staphylococcus carnosus]KKB25725.1 hypothetical protein VV61_03790 [Staphylococcus carnosus]QQS84241.1 accessory Sec system glycosylation chaperone GtfB [Staphylococcus carnosus]UTB99528.1 accessory Sec system glycosylation chaperone GtfB [Staphylococcus carnosus]UTC03679.1 accessory Sec system glycosylation chaperone GtfB [Staphylococcus carnosus]
MINLFERFNQPTETLYFSMMEAGLDHLTVVLNDDGFLPEAVTSPYRFFAENEIKDNDHALYFNEIEVPRFWNIEGDNNQAVIKDMGQVRGKIHYQPNYKQRIVSSVEWLDPQGFVRYRDHYDQFGICFAQTTYDLRGVAIFKEYFTREGEPLIYVNYTTSNYVLTWHGKDYFFETEVDFIVFYLEVMGIDLDSFVINHLGTPLSVVYNLNTEGHDYVVWQEHIDVNTALPGNMQLILNEKGINRSLRDFTLIVPDRHEYDEIVGKVDKDDKQKVELGGYIYPFMRRNQFTPHILTMTNSDQIENLEELVKLSPHLKFHIGALTEMSSKLMAMERYENVKLYPSIERETVKKLYDECDIYLDINSGNEILDAVRRAFLADMLIFAYAETAHNLKYVLDGEDGDVFRTADYRELMHKLHQTVDNHEKWRDLLKRQKQQANAVDVGAFRRLFE